MSENGLVTSGFEPLVPAYDAVFCDIWGVLQNGITAYADAVDVLKRFRSQGGRTVLVSNSARPSDDLAKTLAGLAIDKSVYDSVVTSGDVTRNLLRAYAGRTIHHVGVRIDDPLFDGLDIRKGTADEAVAVVVTSLDDPTETPDDYAARMADWRSRGLPLICANPDIVVEVGGGLKYCAGSIAEIYAANGGQVEMAGKPHTPIYELALKRLEQIMSRSLARSRILAIGDAVRTDAFGAAGFGLDFLFITGSLHAGDLNAFSGAGEEDVRELIASSGARLVGHMPRLVW